MRKQYIRRVSARGQATIPLEVRKILGIEPRGKVMFQVKDGRVEVCCVTMTLEEVCGSVPPLKPPMDFKEVCAIAREELVERIIAEMNPSPTR